MSLAYDLSSTTTLTMVTSSSLAGVPPPAVPASTTLTPAVVSLLGSLVKTIVQLEMASASTHPPAGLVPPPPATPFPVVSLAPPLGLTVSSSGLVVSSSTIPAGITSGMPLLCCASHVVPPIPSGTGDICPYNGRFWGPPCSEVGWLAFLFFFDCGHELLQYTPSLLCDIWVPVVGKRFCPVVGVIYLWVKFCFVFNCVMPFC